MALSLSVEPGDEIRIGDSSIKIVDKTGRLVRLRIDSAEDIEHLRAGQPVSEDKPTPQPTLTRPPLR